MFNFKLNNNSEFNTPIYFGDSFKTTTNNTKKTFSLKRKCSFCQKRPKGALLTTTDTNEIFCDLICGKLYDLNVQHIVPDMKDYRKKYLRNELNDKAKLVYDKCIDKEFVQLSKMYVNYDEILNETDKEKKKKKIASLKREYTALLK